MDSATQLRHSGFNPWADVRLKDWDFALGFCGVDLLDFPPCFSETLEPIGFSWKAEIEFRWKIASKEKNVSLLTIHEKEVWSFSPVCGFGPYGQQLVFTENVNEGNEVEHSQNKADLSRGAMWKHL